MIPEKCYTIKEMSKITGLHENTIRAKKSEIGYFRIGRKILFPDYNVKEYISEHSFGERAQ